MKATWDHTGILLLAFGGPNSLEEVEPFLKNIFSDRSLSPVVVNQVKDRYRLIGGKSPLPEITERQAERLRDNLEKKGILCPVAVGMRYWQPSILSAVNTLREQGIKKILCVIMSPFLTEAVTGGYAAAVAQTINKRYPKTMEAQFALPWNMHPRYLDAVADRVKEGLTMFPANSRDKVFLVFTAHSLPLEHVRNDPYVSEIKKTIAGVVARLGKNEWQLAFQSRGKEGAWLEPSVEEALKEIATSGKKDVLAVPAGFVSDHLETLYDLDIVLKKKAFDLGLNFKRAPSLNVSPQFIEALTEVIEDSLQGI